MNTYATVVLAGGKGTRMRSKLPKVLHPLTGAPLLAYVLKAVEAIPSTSSFLSLDGSVSSHRPIVVLGHEATQVESVFGDRYFYALQHEQLGTGHAVLSAQSVVDALDPLPQAVLVCCGDTPLVRSEMLAQVLAEHLAHRATVTFLTAPIGLPSDHERIVRDSSGHVREIVAVKRATEAQKGLNEVNLGIYCFDRAWLWPTLRALSPNPTGEYCLADLVGIASMQDRVVMTVTGMLDDAIDINDRVQLAAAEQMIRRRILEQHMYAGVTIIDPATTYIDSGVQIGMDTVILPGTMITGRTSIGTSCQIGPGTTIYQSVLGDQCVVRSSVLEEAMLENDVNIGPFSHCRPGAHLARGVHIGNFAEVKNSYLGEGVAMGHFSYLGDATIGDSTNIAAGTITSNYNGITKQKYRTTIGTNAFIGCDTVLVPPVTVGDRAMTGAGAVVNRDVPADALVVGVPARLLRMLHSSETSSAKSSEKEKE